MTEPQELRSVDELFRNTFNNLPETSAESGWDTPGEQVWEKVKSNIQAPRPGVSLQSILIQAGTAVLVAIALYFAFSPKNRVDVKPAEPAVTTVTAPVEIPVSRPEKVESIALEVPNVEPRQTIRHNNIKPPIPRNHTDEKVQISQPQVTPVRETPRSSGAAPLPGSNTDVRPNTTEELKAERIRQLELRWKTSLDLLPVPRPKGN